MDNGMKKVTEEFITERVNHYGKNETEAANSAFIELRDCANRLREALTAEQERLLRLCENAYTVAEGETQRFFYTAGFSDAIRFMSDWMERP
jgi:hypothetical protein